MSISIHREDSFLRHLRESRAHIMKRNEGKQWGRGRLDERQSAAGVGGARRAPALHPRLRPAPLELPLRFPGPFLRESPRCCCADSGLNRCRDSAALKNILKALFQAPNSVPYLSSILLPWGEREKKAEWITHTSPPCWEPAAVTAHSAPGEGDPAALRKNCSAEESRQTQRSTEPRDSGPLN